MIDKVVQRLSQIGYDVSENEKSLVYNELEKVSRFIKTSCNVSSIDADLQYVIIERTCGNFLFFLKNNGQFDGFENEPFVKEILEGDVKVVFDENSVLSAEQRIDKIIDYLMGYGEDIIISKRCVCW